MTDLPALPHRLDRSVTIRAGRDTVFRFFTDSARWAAWWGAGSTIDPRPGGGVAIRYPDGTEARGEVVEIAAPDRIVFTYGYASGVPIPPGSSLVVIDLQSDGPDTIVRLSHAFADPAVRDQHHQGWRYQLSLFANVVADERHARAAAAVDSWFACWSEPDDQRREGSLRAIAAAGLTLHDRYSALDGLAEVAAHIGAAQRFMPGIRIERAGELRHCQGSVLVDWIARAADGRTPFAGTSVFVLDGAGSIRSVTGFWRPA